MRRGDLVRTTSVKVHSPCNTLQATYGSNPRGTRKQNKRAFVLLFLGEEPLEIVEESQHLDTHSALGMLGYVPATDKDLAAQLRHAKASLEAKDREIAAQKVEIKDLRKQLLELRRGGRR